jgi:osmotically inducible protein OsmC
MKRYATAHWEGTGKEGKGNLTTQSTTLNQTQYSFSSRFADGVGTNPEELLAAAHAGCFTMKLSFNISKEGLTPESIDTKSTVNLNAETGTIDTVALEVTAKVPGLNPDKFQELAKDAEANCPVSKLFKATITMDAKLV